MEHTKHLWRAGFILLFLALSGVTVQNLLKPESFGDKGHFRFNSVAEHMDKPMVHGSPRACQACHEETFTTKSEGKHAAVSCEVCHGPLGGHAVEGDETGEKKADMPVKKSYVLCAYCHQKLLARPEGTPQVEIKEHLVAQEIISYEDEVPENACIMCHDVHSPGI